MLRKISIVVSFCFLMLLLSSFQNNFKPVYQRAFLKTIIIDAGHGYPDAGARGEYSNESSLTLAIALKLGSQLEQVLPDCKIIYTRTDENLPDGLSNKNEANRLRAKMANENHGDLFISIHVNSMPTKYRKEIQGYRKETYYVYSGKGKKRKKIVKKRTVPIVRYYKLSNTIQGTETYIWAVSKNDSKKQFVGSNQEEMSGETDSTYEYFDSPEAKILASLRTKKYFDNSRLIAAFVEDEFKKQGRTSYGVKQRNYEGIWVLQATAMPSILVETGFICTPEDEEYLNSDKGQNEVSYAVMRAVLRFKYTLENGTDSLPDSSLTERKSSSNN